MRSLPLTMVVVATLASTMGLAGPALASAGVVEPRPAASAPSAMPAAGTFYPTADVRVLGTATTGYAVAPGAPAAVTTAGRPGLPSAGVSALLVNVTAVAGPADVRLSFAGSGLDAPGPLVTVPAATTRSTLVTVPLATTAGFDLSASGGAASVTADVVGFYAADDTVVAGYGVSGGYQPVDTTRLAGAGLLAPGERSLLAVDLGAVVTPHVNALLLSVIATPAGGGPGSTGSLSVSAPASTSPSSAPSSSPGSADADQQGVVPTTVSFAPSAPAGNLALVPAQVDSSGRVGVAVTNTGTVPARFSLDLVGFYDDGGIGPNLRFRSLPQTRVLDTSTGLGDLPTLTPGASQGARLPDSVVDDSTFALAGVLTTAASGASAVAALSPDGPVTDASTVPVGAGVTSVAVQPEVGVGRDLAVITGAGPTLISLTFDVVGSFEASPSVTNPAARGWVPPVSAWQISSQRVS